MIELKEPFISLWQGKDVFTEVENLQGDTFRALEKRRTIRFYIGDRSYFLKWHQGTTVKEIIKNLLYFRLPVLGADREWNAIHQLHSAGVNTMTGVAFGERGLNPIKRESFIITEDLTPTISLEDYTLSWQDNPPKYNIKLRIIHCVADMVRRMHHSGVNHRDCYICHFLLHLPFDGDNPDLKISIIDLHRAQIRKKVPNRWINKDLIGLYFSSANIGLTSRDIFRFLKVYYQKPLCEILEKEKSLLNTAEEKAKKIRARTIRKSL